MNSLNPYLKFIVAILGAVSVALQTEFPGNRWANLAIAIITAFLVYLVPNSPKGPGT